MIASNTFLYLCNTLHQVRECRSTSLKTEIFSNYLNELPEERDLELAVQFAAEGAFSRLSGKRASIGSRTAGLAASRFCEIDYDRVFKPCRTATGSNSETIRRLLENMPAARVKQVPVHLTLRQIEVWFNRLADQSSREDKINLLTQLWQQMTPLEVQYSVRMMGQGSLRIGFDSRSVMSSVAKAFASPKEDVRYVHMITGSIGKTAILARNKSLDRAHFQLFQPISFMLASPSDLSDMSRLTDYVVEEKFDGMRAQVHVSDSRAEIYSRDLNVVTSSFPEVAGYFNELEIGDAVLDGEICVFIDGAIQPFQMLQKRMGVKKPSRTLTEDLPVLFVAFDLLYFNGKPIFKEPLKKRRKTLEELHESHRLVIANQFEAAGSSEIEEMFNRSLEHGNEGLMLKHKEDVYEYGQRGKSWIKIKEPGGSIDTVMIYAHAGSGRRGGLYSDFTFGISVKEDDRYEEEFVPIGKAYGGYTNEELKKMNELIKDLTVERYGPTLGLRPELVVEIEFDDIQVNRRTKAGYSLRLPRFKAIRWDLSPNDVNTLRDVEEIYSKKVDGNYLKQGKHRSFLSG